MSFIVVIGMTMFVPVIVKPGIVQSWKGWSMVSTVSQLRSLVCISGFPNVAVVCRRTRPL